nr:GNAT family N-acetyltransferase [Brevibacillus sp. SYP-B805]
MAEATEAWNKGFEGYYADMTATVERFVWRLGSEGISPSLSVVAFADGEPAGLVLTGIRTVAGKKVAWNGGTGVASAYRRRGVGKAMMEAVLQIYREEGVAIATLEAISHNENAIALYRQMGYEVVDRLLFLQHTKGFASNPFAGEAGRYQVRHGIPHDVRPLSFCVHMAPWQTQWAGVRDGEAVLVSDERGEVVGYALYKRVFDDNGRLAAIHLHQCVAAPHRTDAAAIMRAALSHVFAPFEAVCKRSTFNFPASNETAVALLREAGFTPFLEQVYMTRSMEA